MSALLDAGVYAAPLFAPLSPWLAQLPASPDGEALRSLAARQPIFTPAGQPIRFVPPQADGRAYECRIWECGEVETRPDNWHDFFNALIWLAFPQTKLAISAAHVAAMQGAGERRSRIRDALTHFDECGIVVCSTQPWLLDLLRDFQWKKLFVEQRAEVMRSMRFIVFGHAIYEHLLNPFRGLTAKAILYEVPGDWLEETDEAQRLTVDARLAADFAAGLHVEPRALQPLPVLGIPGMTPENEDPAYYDDTWQFRPGRRKTA